jgi:hypothetical protein
VISLDDRRRRRPVWSTVAKIAAAIVVVAGLGTGLGFVAKDIGGSSKSASTSNAASAPQAASGGAFMSIQSIRASGHDYANDLQAVPPQYSVGPAPLAHADTSKQSGGAASIPPETIPRVVPPGLERLDAGGLAGCVAELVRQVGGTAQSADFAYYRGEPVVVIRVPGVGTFAVGAACGVPGYGIDLVARTP